MKKDWTIIESWLQENAPQTTVFLNKGVTNDEIANLEGKIGAKLPADFVEFYKIHNGASEELGLIDTEELLSFERILEEWQVWKNLLDSHTFEDEEGVFTSDSPKTIKTDWWNPLWIPITYDGSGNHFCLDLDPTSKGNYGQIIRMWHDDAERTLEAISFSAWIGKFATDLQKEVYVYSEDYGGIINKQNLLTLEQF